MRSPTLLTALAALALQASAFVAVPSVAGTASRHTAGNLHGEGVRHASWGRPRAVAPALRASASATEQEAKYQEARDAAVKAAEEFGPTSQEARIAWDAVEEIESSNNSIAWRPSLDELCDTSNMEECGAYNERVDQLKDLIQSQPPSYQIEALLDEVERLKGLNSRLREQLMKAQNGLLQLWDTLK